ncbi:hypothetical protein [Dactylosporangium darangshiense]|uniref:Uncharacterized protein n=1 Tax=Dactylosporangium darangshiense TaxID=579108 RepID=A0ABP8DM10_9ACTN
MAAATRRLALRRADLDGGRCPLPAEWGPVLPPHVTVTLEHRAKGIAPGRVEFDAEPAEDDGWRLTGLAWPDDVHPGMVVALARRAGGAEVVVRTVVLEEPMRIDGVNYYHEYDPVVVTREVAPGVSNRGKVLQAVRRLGRVFDDGSAVFPEAQLVRRGGLGRGARGTFLLRNAVEQLIREGFVTRVEGSVDGGGNPSYPAIDGEEPAEMLFYAPLIEPAAVPGDDEGGEGSERREHWVSGFLRKLPPGAQPSPRQLSLHRQAVDSEQIDDVPLAPGYTFVKKHHRNG